MEHWGTPVEIGRLLEEMLSYSTNYFRLLK